MDDHIRNTDVVMYFFFTNSEQILKDDNRKLLIKQLFIGISFKKKKKKNMAKYGNWSFIAFSTILKNKEVAKCPGLCEVLKLVT